jgi:hemerythrin-like domain-containing protein
MYPHHSSIESIAREILAELPKSRSALFETYIGRQNFTGAIRYLRQYNHYPDEKLFLQRLRDRGCPTNGEIVRNYQIVVSLIAKMEKEMERLKRPSGSTARLSVAN